MLTSDLGLFIFFPPPNSPQQYHKIITSNLHQCSVKSILTSDLSSFSGVGRLCAFVAGLLPSVSGVLRGSVDQEYPWQAAAAHAFFALSCPQVTWIVIYPLVNVYITNWKDPPFLWVNPLFLWSFSIANCNKLPEGSFM
jgi:hypothetical protein